MLDPPNQAEKLQRSIKGPCSVCGFVPSALRRSLIEARHVLLPRRFPLETLKWAFRLARRLRLYYMQYTDRDGLGSLRCGGWSREKHSATAAAHSDGPIWSSFGMGSTYRLNDLASAYLALPGFDRAFFPPRCLAILYRRQRQTHIFDWWQ